eukprot:350566-Chlamydomonas_euryale.AAC.6
MAALPSSLNLLPVPSLPLPHSSPGALVTAVSGVQNGPDDHDRYGQRDDCRQLPDSRQAENALRVVRKRRQQRHALAHALQRRCRRAAHRQAAQRTIVPHLRRRRRRKRRVCAVVAAVATASAADALSLMPAAPGRDGGRAVWRGVCGCCCSGGRGAGPRERTGREDCAAKCSIAQRTQQAWHRADCTGRRCGSGGAGHIICCVTEWRTRHHSACCGAEWSVFPCKCVCRHRLGRRWPSKLVST